MRSPLAFIPLLVAALAGSSCFNPSITTGGFKCSSVWKKDCPDGYSCVNERCWKGGVVTGAGDGGVDIKPDVPPDLPTETPSDKPDGTSPTDKVEVACTIKPVSGCTPMQPGKCDPLCQTGCDGCHQKCSVNTAGTFTCNDPASGLVGMEGDTCEIVSSGSELQTDQCAPGLVCVDLACKSQCAKLCRVDGDCPGSTCTRNYVTGFKICDVKAVDCNPVRALGATKCPGTAQGCYLSATITDRTVCDCPGASQAEGKTCMLSRDCLPGLACVDATGTTDFRCYIVCSLQGATSGCTGAQTCHALNGSTKYGYCRN